MQRHIEIILGTYARAWVPRPYRLLHADCRKIMLIITAVFFGYFLIVYWLTYDDFDSLRDRININQVTGFWNRALLSEFFLKSIVFFCVASIILARAKLFLQTIGFNDEIIHLLFAIVSGLLLALYPIRSAYTFILFFLLIHIRFLHLLAGVLSKLTHAVVWIFPSAAMLYIGYMVVMNSYASHGINFASTITIAYIALTIGMAKTIYQEVNALSGMIKNMTEWLSKTLLKLHDSMAILAMRFGVSIGGSQQELKNLLSP